MDETTRKVQRILHQGFLDAHPEYQEMIARSRADERPDDPCDREAEDDDG